ncbi:MAG: hypothetical protein K2P78_11445 [Gemmataceae bacterium]|nr:hypothetical protein [Gemmataceae bacterium]
MRCSRRQFFAAAGLGLVAAAGCGDKKKDETPNPDLGPPPKAEPPPPRGAPPSADKKKQ